MESVPRLTDPVVRGNSWDQRLAHKVNKFHVARADLPRKKLISSVVSATRTLHMANRVARTRGERSMRESFADPAANPHTAWGAGFSRLLRRPALPGPFRYGTPSSTDRRNTIVSPAERFGNPCASLDMSAKDDAALGIFGSLPCRNLKSTHEEGLGSAASTS